MDTPQCHTILILSFIVFYMITILLNMHFMYALIPSSNSLCLSPSGNRQGGQERQPRQEAQEALCGGVCGSSGRRRRRGRVRQKIIRELSKKFFFFTKICVFYNRYVCKSNSLCLSPSGNRQGGQERQPRQEAQEALCGGVCGSSGRRRRRGRVRQKIIRELSKKFFFFTKICVFYNRYVCKRS